MSTGQTDCARGTHYIDFLYDETGSVYSIINDGTQYYFVKNLQGDVIQIRSIYGTVVVEYTYDAWGNVLSITGMYADTLGVNNPIRYRGYYQDFETGFYYLQSRYYDPAVRRFINADGYMSTGQGMLGNNMYAYCLNNPVNNIDSSGEIALTIALGGYALWKLGMFFIGAVVTVAAVDTLVQNPPTFPSISIPKVESKPKVETKEKDIATTLPKSLPKDTIIYRYYASKSDNLAPRIGVDYDGLSFSTKPPKPGISAVVTTIEQVNATGVLWAIPTGGTHVTIIPVNGNVEEWMRQGQSSIWSQTLSGIVVEWKGLN